MKTNSFTNVVSFICNKKYEVKVEITTMDCASEYHCLVCSRNFKKFIIFEGHLTFNRKCRENYGSYMQCYICKDKYQNLAALQYHLQSHKKYSFEKSVQHEKTVGNDVMQISISNPTSDESKTNGFCCGICGSLFDTKFHLIEHSTIHSTAIDTATSSTQLNGNESVEGNFEKEVGHQRIVSKRKTVYKSYRCQICNANCYCRPKLGKIKRES